MANDMIATDQSDAALLDEPVAEKPKEVEDPAAALNKRIADNLQSRIEASVRARRRVSGEWKRNVELRVGRMSTLVTTTSTTDDTEQKTELNPDWSLTKTKTANLFSQVPAVQGTHENDQYRAAVPFAIKQLNYEIGEKRANMGVAMEEVMNDVVNAAGVGAMILGYAARFETVEVPVMDTTTMDSALVQQMLAMKTMPMKSAERVTDDKFFCNRISPSDLLWPDNFIGSNFDDGDFLGRRGRCAWGEGKTEFKLEDSQQDAVLAAEETPVEDTLRTDPHREDMLNTKQMTFDELYYWRYRQDPDEKSFKAIWRIVFVKGIDTPVIHEPWKGQRYNEATRKYVGACKYPIRVLTLTYITDHAVPPSDTEAGRPQVNDLRRSRAQMFENRKRSIPLRWFDVNRIDRDIQASLMQGTYQGMIPTNGDGTRSIGEIARASYPAEDMAFDQQAKADLMESWQVGPNQLGTEAVGRKTAQESDIVQRNFATRIGQERGRVASFFLSGCEVMMGLLCLYSDFPVLAPQERQQMQQAWNNQEILHDLVLKIRPDSTIMLDTQSRLSRIERVLNVTVKSGYVNPKPLIVEFLELSGVDPSEVIVDPQPKEPEKPSISYSFKGKEDIMSPFVVALLMKHGEAPSKEELQAAVQLLLSAHEPPAVPGADAPGMAGAAAPGVLPPAPGAVVPHHEDIQKPEFSMMDKVAKRSRDLGSSD